MRRVYAFSAGFLACLLGAGLGFVSPWFMLLLAPAAVFGYISVVLALTVYRFSPHGGDYQRRLHGLIAETAGTRPGAVLDVGCGSGSLAIAIATAAPDCTVVGVDSWDENWEYSQQQCEHNARCTGVADRVTFSRRNAAALGYRDATFDTVVSCLTFHEVREATDRADALTEALRVLRPGGRFAVLDLFAAPGHFTSLQHVRDSVARADAVITHEHALHELLALPYPLGDRKVLGYAVLMAGIRNPDPLGDRQR